MITYPLNFPTVGGIESVEFNAMDKVAASESEFTDQDFVFAHQGKRLEVLITSVLMNRTKADEWISFLLSLEGKLGTFYFGDPFNTAPRGVGTGTPLINGSSEIGQDINSDGWTPSTVNILRAGDWLQFGIGSARRLYKQLIDADSDVSGNVLLTLWPKVTTAFADNTPITVNNPQGVFRLATNERSWSPRPDGLYRFAIPAKEVR